jgi:hypothetical protein
MKRFIISAIMLGILAGPVYAQGRAAKEDPEQALERAAKKKNDIEIDQQYRATLRKTDQNAAPARIDPWANMREPTQSTDKR